MFGTYFLRMLEYSDSIRIEIEKIPYLDYQKKSPHIERYRIVEIWINLATPPDKRQCNNTFETTAV